MKTPSVREEQRERRKHVNSHYIKNQGFSFVGPTLLTGVVGRKPKMFWGGSRWGPKAMTRTKLRGTIEGDTE